jgi:hypothetical protein
MRNCSHRIFCFGTMAHRVLAAMDGTPSSRCAQNYPGQQKIESRNAVWVAWLRLPAAMRMQRNAPSMQVGGEPAGTEGRMAEGCGRIALDILQATDAYLKHATQTLHASTMTWAEQYEEYQVTPCASIASATFTNPAMLAPSI